MVFTRRQLETSDLERPQDMPNRLDISGRKPNLADYGREGVLGLYPSRIERVPGLAQRFTVLGLGQSDGYRQHGRGAEQGRAGRLHPKGRNPWPREGQRGHELSASSLGKHPMPLMA